MKHDESLCVCVEWCDEERGRLTFSFVCVNCQLMNSVLEAERDTRLFSHGVYFQRLLYVDV